MRRVELQDFVDPSVDCSDLLLDLDEGLGRLAREDADAAELVELRLFAGLSVTEAGETLDMSRSTAYENWHFAAVGSRPKWIARLKRGEPQGRDGLNGGRNLQTEEFALYLNRLAPRCVKTTYPVATSTVSRRIESRNQLVPHDDQRRTAQQFDQADFHRGPASQGSSRSPGLS